MSTLGVIVLAFGVGVVGAFALDYHSHTCASCGKKWKHLGAFNEGDATAHACPGCGKAQWYRTGHGPGPGLPIENAQPPPGDDKAPP